MNPRTRRAALCAIGAVAILASANALAHSYAGLYDWAVHHRLTGWQAKSWPAEVDVFLAVPRGRGGARVGGGGLGGRVGGSSGPCLRGASGVPGATAGPGWLRLLPGGFGVGWPGVVGPGG